MKKLFKIIFIFFILINIGCKFESNPKNEQLSKTNQDKFDPSFSIDIENLSGKSEFPREVYLKNDQKYKGRITITNSSKADERYGMLILKNYTQTPYYVSNKKFYFYKFNIHAKSSRKFIIETEKFNKGFFDVDFVVVARPDNLSKNFETRKLSPDAVFVYRANFFVDSKIAPNANFINKTNARNLFNENIILSKSKIVNVGQDILFYNKNAKNINYNIYLSNFFDKKINFVAVAFLNYRQINVLKDQKVYFGELGPQKAVNIPIGVKLNKKKNELFAIFIPKPFSQIGKEPKQETIEEEMAQSSFRVALEKK